jgi:putative oxidoreductase
MDELWLIGRVLFAGVFIWSGASHLIDLDGAMRTAASRVEAPAARLLVIGSALAYTVGGSSILLGIWGDAGALLLIVTLIPLTFVGYPFWSERDAAIRRMQQALFLKNIALVGGAVLLFSFFARATVGPGLPYTITDGAFSFR